MLVPLYTYNKHRELDKGLFLTLTFIPLGRLIEEEHYIFGIIRFELLLNCVVGLLSKDKDKLDERVNEWWSTYI